MDWKEYRETPDEGTFEKIEHRLRLRRMGRIGMWSLASVAVAATVVLLVVPHGTETVAVNQSNAELIVPATVDKVMALDTTVMHAAADSRMQTVPVPVEQDNKGVTPNVQICVPQAETDVTKVKEIETPKYSRVSEAVAVEYVERELEQTVQNITVTDGSDDIETDVAIDVSNTPKSGDTTQERPHYEDNLIWAPNIIIPHGDIDEARTFGLKYSSQVEHFNVQIYNRRGMRVFSSSDPQFVWDGTCNNVDVPQGAYVWIATFRDTSGRMRQEKGTVTVVR